MSKKTLAITALVFLAGCSSLNNAMAVQSFSVTGIVVSTEQIPYACEEKKTGFGSNPVATGAVGAVVGSAFGSGKGKVAAIAVGAATGAVIGMNNREENDRAHVCKNAGWKNTVKYIDPVSGVENYHYIDTIEKLDSNSTVTFKVRR